MQFPGKTNTFSLFRKVKLPFHVTMALRTPERGFGPLSSLGITGTPGKKGEDYDISGPGD